MKLDRDSIKISEMIDEVCDITECDREMVSSVIEQFLKNLSYLIIKNDKVNMQGIGKFYKRACSLGAGRLLLRVYFKYSKKIKRVFREKFGKFYD